MTKPGSSHKLILLFMSLGIGLLLACTQKGFLGGKAKSGEVSVQSAALEPETKASDRPVDTGAGVPGYLVCSLATVQDQNVQVGCNITDAQGTRLPTGPEGWKRYDMRLPPDAPLGVTITKTAAANTQVYDAMFNFTGGDKTVLSDVAKRSTYGFVYLDATGQDVRIETLPPPPAQPVAVPTSNNVNLCAGGALVDGVCFVPVDTSCTDYCARGALNPHPYVINKFGAGPNIDSDESKRSCRDLFVQIRGTEDFEFDDTTSVHGWGCFEDYEGHVVFDKDDTKPFEYPRIGDRRICGCL